MSDLSAQNQATGSLFLISTPIGNLEDITLRAIRLLKEVDIICAEDTRVTGRLLAHFQIKNRMLSFYAQNAAGRVPQVLAYLQQGMNIALVSDAGTPGISDPGYVLVKACVLATIPIVPVPGASALLASITASGLPSDRFVFEGFLPRKKGRQTKLGELSKEAGTIVVYESAVRLQKTLEDIGKHFGNRYIVVSRELTKRFEEFIRGDVSAVLELLKTRKLKGEIVLLIAGIDFKPYDV